MPGQALSATIDPTKRDARHKREIRAGIDWVTYIARTPAAAAGVARLAHELVEEHVCPTAKEEKFHCGGYRGWQRDAIRLGHRGAMSMLQLSGEVAAASTVRLEQSGGLPTRLDVQTTCYLSAPDRSFGRRFMRPRTPSSSQTPSSPPLSGCWKRSDGAFLGTGGQRTNCRYLRVYDKGVQTRTLPPGTAWRAECEIKYTVAPAVWRDYLTAEDKWQWCYDTCAVQWQLAGWSWPLRKHSPEARRVTGDPKPPTDAERSAAWIRQSVRPVIKRLQKVYTETQLLQMLGLLPEEEEQDA